MFGRINTFKKLALAAVVAGAALIPTSAFAGDRGDRYYYGKHHDRGHVDFSIGYAQGGYVQTQQVWVQPVYRTECDRVWIEPVYRTECGRVWVEPVYGCREYVRWECGRRVVVRERVVVTPGYWQNTSTQVLVCAGHWEARERQVLVTEGYWATAPVAAPRNDAFVFNFGYRR
jgi:hypothetical protein